MTKNKIVGIQFWIKLLIPNSLAIDGTPTIIPFDRNIAKKLHKKATRTA